MNDPEKEAHSLILEIYDAALEPNNWHNVLRRASEFVGAMGALVFELTGPPDKRQLIFQSYSAGYDEAVMSDYLKHFHTEELQDQEVLAAHSRKTDDIQLIKDDVLANSREELERHRNVAAMKIFGVRYRAGALLNKDIHTRDRFAFQFSKSQGPLDAENAYRCGLILPHLAKAMNVGRPTSLLAERHSMVVDSLNRLAVGVCIVDDNRNVIVMNHEFERQADEYNMFRISSDKRLDFNNSIVMKSAAEMFSSVSFHGRFGARPRKEALQSPAAEKTKELCVEIIPMNNSSQLDGSLTKGSIVFSLDTSRHTGIDVARLGELYQLTASEQQVLNLLSDGLTNPQIAESCSKSVETVNSQVKSILSKTMAANRTQLIRLAAQTSNSLII